MILHFQTNLKDYIQNISNNYTSTQYTCPKCGAKHAMRRHGFYTRHVLTIENNTFHDHTLSVLRLQCTSCNSTHAVLPMDVIPYSIYSLSTVLLLISKVLVEQISLTETAYHFNLSYQLISFFIKRFLSFESDARILLKELHILDTLTLSAMLQLIINRPTFISEYFIHTRWLFLMQKFRSISPKPIFVGTDFS
ncbi:MAG: DUF6431 domain-containing protein [Niameybacter sp.]